jgi:hypothetical protein
MDMVRIIQVSYGRSIIPDNYEPNMHIKKYESEHFEFQAVSTDDGETTDDLIDACEREVLRQHKRLNEKRLARKDSVGLQDELDSINEMLGEFDADPKCLYDKSKLMARKGEIEKLLEDVK